MKRLLLTFLGMVMLIAAHATGFETINGLRYLIDTDSKTATLVADTVKYKGDIVVPEKVTLAGIDYPVVAFGKQCFESCLYLTSVTIPSSVTSLGDYCFSSCDSLRTINIPLSVDKLGYRCFINSGLKSIDIPSSVTSIGDYCFSGCKSLKTIKIPSSITSLGDYCFNSCTSLDTINIPSSVTSLGNSCFRNCEGLKSIQIPSSVTSIGQLCFCGCFDLTFVGIPISVTDIGRNCFDSCTRLISITFPSSVKNIGAACFEGCNKLISVYCYAIDPPIKTGLYSDENFLQPSNTILYVPASSVEKYKQADGWKDFIAILPIKGTEEDTKGKCEKPTITYANGKLQFESSTTGAEYHYTLSCNDVKSDVYSKEGRVSLAAAYNITAYATADNYIPSDKATATLYWINGRLNAPTGINAAKMRGVLASAQDGFVTISGMADGETVALYTVDGKLIGESRAVNGIASYAVSNVPVVIAKIGGQSIKIAVQ